MNRFQYYAAIIWNYVSGFANYAVENKPYIVALLAAATAVYQATGQAVPTWLYILYVAMGGAALHSSTKQGTIAIADSLPQNSPKV